MDQDRREREHAIKSSSIDQEHNYIKNLQCSKCSQKAMHVIGHHTLHCLRHDKLYHYSVHQLECRSCHYSQKFYFDATGRWEAELSSLPLKERKETEEHLKKFCRSRGLVDE